MDLSTYLEGFHTWQTKPSRIRRAEDEWIASQAFMKRHAGPYDAQINPHPPDSSRHERVRKSYERLYKQNLDYEPIFRDICQAYGYEPPTHLTNECP